MYLYYNLTFKKIKLMENFSIYFFFSFKLFDSFVYHQFTSIIYFNSKIRHFKELFLYLKSYFINLTLIFVIHLFSSTNLLYACSMNYLSKKKQWTLQTIVLMNLISYLLGLYLNINPVNIGTFINFWWNSISWNK